jgi:NADH-quinone oxidoreductase subunit F
MNSSMKLNNRDGIPAKTFSGRVMRELEEQEWSASSSVAFKTIYQMGRQVAIDVVKEAGVRDRAGAGFATGDKWLQVRYAESEHKYFVCNASPAQPGSLKQGWLIRANPLKAIESVAIATHCVGADVGYVCLPQSCREEIALLESAVQTAHESGILGKNVFGAGSDLYLNVVELPDFCVDCDELELLDLMERNALRPRETLFWPSSEGLFGKPTAINNLETVLQCRYAIKVGPQTYREEGTNKAPGTMIFSLTGQVNRPGLYELPLGAGLRELIFEHGEGLTSSIPLKAVFPGGIGSAILGAESLDTRLDFERVREAGSDLGAGEVIVFGKDTCMVKLAADLAGSFKYRSGCHFSKKAAISLISLVSLFQHEFDQHGSLGFCPITVETVSQAAWEKTLN